MQENYGLTSLKYQRDMITHKIIGYKLQPKVIEQWKARLKEVELAIARLENTFN